MSRSLSPCPAEVQVERLIAEADHITLVVRVFRPVAPCPECTRPSYRIHSYYERRLADLPWNGIPVKIRLRTRRFFCDTEDCAQRIFTERLPETTQKPTHVARSVWNRLCAGWHSPWAVRRGDALRNGWVLESAETPCCATSDACRWHESQFQSARRQATLSSRHQFANASSPGVKPHSRPLSAERRPANA